MKHFLLPKGKMIRRVEGLRDGAPPNPVMVYRLNPDGSMGEFLRTEMPKVREHGYNYYKR